MANVLEDRLEKIREICSVKDYTVCFIGEVGVGKSTAISNLLGLIDDSKLEEGNKLNEIPILKTAEGRTTLCETEIHFNLLFGATTEIEVEPLSNDEFEKLVNDFCLYNLKLDELKDKLEDKYPTEIRRTIKNMSKFPTTSLENQINFIKEQLELETVEEEGLLKLAKKAVLKAINYQARTNTLLQVDTNIQNLKVWVKETFSNINDGKLDNVPYPQKVIIKIAKDQWNIKVPESVKVVKDTRGMDVDNIAARDDLISAVRDPKNICIICDRISTYGNIVSTTFFKNQFKDKDLKYRNFVIGIEQGAQLTRVNEAENREDGKNLKKEESLPSWNEISLDEENMLFYNAYFGIKYDNEEYEIMRVNEEDYESEQQSIWDELDVKIKLMYKSYEEELQSITEQLEVFSKNQLEDKHLDKLMEFKDYINQGISNLIYNTSIESKIEKELRTINAGYLRGSVNSRGEYVNYNIYSQAKNLSYEDFDYTTKELIIRLEEKCNNLFSGSDEMEKTLKEILFTSIKEKYKKYREDNAEDYKQILKEQVYSDAVWTITQQYWGNKDPNNPSRKYRDRVADTLIQVIKEKGYKEEILQIENAKKLFEAVQDTLNLEKTTV